MKTMTRLFVSLVTLGLSASAAADGVTQMVINGRSFHVGAQQDWNENNYGLGIEYQFDSRSRWIRTVMANAFVDSRDSMSYMAGGGLHRRLIAIDRMGGLYFDAGVSAFLMSRKDVMDYRPFVGALPSVTVGNRYGGINLSYVPGKALRSVENARLTDPGIDGVFFMQFKFRMDALFSH